MSTQTSLTIESLGSQGEGVAGYEGRKVFIPFTLPGEQVAADVEGERGTLLRVVRPSPQRVSPICKHFGACGGCALQHAGAGLYRPFKRDQVAHALKSRGFAGDIEIAELVTVAPGTRRRAAFAASRDGDDITLGYHAARSHALAAIDECPVLHPAIVRELPNLRNLLAFALARKSTAELHITGTAHGLDVMLTGASVEMTAKRRATLGAWLNATPAMLRLTIDGEQIAKRAEPEITFSGHTVTLPAGKFLQAVPEAEAQMLRLVEAGFGRLKPKDRIADLFCGLGAFSLPLAKRNEVLAVEWDVDVIAALQAAALQPGLRKLEVLRRDLFREPLSARELEPFAAVVFDPPRAGAQAQAESLAASSVRTVIAVSCNPATFARDARTLVDGGYRLDLVTPIDQFLFSPHVEVVAVFKKGKKDAKP